MKLLIIATLLSGCVGIQHGQVIDNSTIQSFKDGVTTSEQVINTIGEPQFKQTSSDGTSVLIYARGEMYGNMLGAYSGTTHTVTMQFDVHGVLKSRTSNISSYGTK